MSGAPRVRSLNITEPNLENKPTLKPGSKPVSTRPDKIPVSPNKKKESPTKSTQKVLKRHELFMHSNLSLNASCSSMESFSSRASTGRIGRRVGPVTRTVRREKTLVKVDPFQQDVSEGKQRCAWVTANSEPCYVAFHDEEWGVPVHDDKRLFELLVLSGALAELTWPEILTKRQLFREVFMNFDVDQISKLNDKKLLSQGSIAISLLSEPKIRAILENSRQILKIIAEFGSFNQYCWNFVNQKPIINKFRYARQVPVKTPKAEFMSKDMLKRGLRSVGPTVVYSFMQVAGLTNDHLSSCFRCEECTVETNEDAPCVERGLECAVNGLSVS